MAPTLYLRLDGTGVPMRASEVEGRNGKQPDGSAKTREVKLVTVWTAEGRYKQGVPVRDPGSVSYSAALEAPPEQNALPEVPRAGACVSRAESSRPAAIVVGTRLKRAGMHWTVARGRRDHRAGCCKLSVRFEDFWERRLAAGTAPLEVISQN